MHAEEETSELTQQIHSLQRAYKKAGIFRQNSSSTQQITSPTEDLSALLQFADALLRNVVTPVRDANQRRHVAVFGGTQVGKSTVVNVLAGSPVARVYHTAGYTRHAQAFVLPGIDCQKVLRGFPAAFHNFECVEMKDLALNQPKQFSVALISGNIALPETVLWDTPDCDSVDAASYRRGMLEALTLADCVVYVTSREKYAVNAILEWLVLLLRAGVPVVPCFNMIPADQQQEVTSAAREALTRVAERHGDGATAAAQQLAAGISLPYVHGNPVEIFTAKEPATASTLRHAVQQSAISQSTNRKSVTLRFLSEITPQVIAPAVDQLQASTQWKLAVDMALQSFVDDYRSRYLDNTQRYDAFNRVGIEILTLLNPPIPGLRKTLIAVRTALSLPARAIVFGSKALFRFFNSGGTSFQQQPIISNEVVTMQEANDRLLSALAGLPLQHKASSTAQPYWTALERGWQMTMPRVQEQFRLALEQHRARTDEWIRETAQGIYQELAKNPVKLNMLRTGRIAADAGAILVAIHTGGQGNILHDIIVTPAMMAVVEAISQQLASSYVEQRRRELRDRLFADTQVFAQKVYGEPLQALGAEALKSSGFGELNVADLTTLSKRFAALAARLSTERVN